MQNDWSELNAALREFGRCLMNELLISGRALAKFCRVVRKVKRDEYIGRGR